ncbi:hypothetical protein OKW96_04695 [Sphingobacterium sp. KU25419]|nr:hypothetical protein OKW96_04695 [Sphingobacterium sp. KU25419]
MDTTTSGFAPILDFWQFLMWAMAIDSLAPRQTFAKMLAVGQYSSDH